VEQRQRRPSFLVPKTAPAAGLSAGGVLFALAGQLCGLSDALCAYLSKRDAKGK